MGCPHCKCKQGHYSDVLYKCIDNKWKSQDYWFCHTCAHKIYDDETQFVLEE